MTLLKLLMIVAGPVMAQTQAVRPLPVDPGGSDPACGAMCQVEREHSGGTTLPTRRAGVPRHMAEELARIGASLCAGGSECRTQKDGVEADGTRVSRILNVAGCDARGCEEVVVGVLRRHGDGREGVAVFARVDAQGRLLNRSRVRASYDAQGVQLGQSELAMSEEEGNELVVDEWLYWVSRPVPPPPPGPR